MSTTRKPSTARANKAAAPAPAPAPAARTRKKAAAPAPAPAPAPAAKPRGLKGTEQGLQRKRTSRVSGTLIASWDTTKTPAGQFPKPQAKFVNVCLSHNARSWAPNWKEGYALALDPTTWCTKCKAAAAKATAPAAKAAPAKAAPAKAAKAAPAKAAKAAAPARAARPRKRTA